MFKYSEFQNILTRSNSFWRKNSLISTFYHEYFTKSCHRSYTNKPWCSKFLKSNSSVMYIQYLCFNTLFCKSSKIGILNPNMISFKITLSSLANLIPTPARYQVSWKFSHFKLEFLWLLKVILHDKLVDEVWVQVIPHNFCSSKLKHNYVSVT